jgi:hypothetical protein
MRCRTTAILRASATRAFLNPARLASLAPQTLSGFDPRVREEIAVRVDFSGDAACGFAADCLPDRA